MGLVVFINGLVLFGLGALALLNAALFAETRDVFLSAGLICCTLGTFCAIATSADLRSLSRLQAFLLTASVWLTAAAAGCLPLYLWTMSLTDAFFESMSGITTTGSTVLVGLDGMPWGILLWRALLQWIGGVGFIVTGIALLPLLRVGGMQLFRTESSERGDPELPSAARFAAATLWVYGGLSLLCAAVYRFGGMSMFDAIAHAMTTLSTGGLSTSDLSFGKFANPFLQWSGTLFMLAGALPFAWYIRIASRGRFGSEQVRALLFFLLTVILALAAYRVVTTGEPLELALREVAFNVVSVVTTTGYATTDYTLWGPPAVATFLILTAFGGCTGSTSGGVKMMRWIVLTRSVGAQIRTLYLPHGVFHVRYESKAISEDQTSGIISFFWFFLLTFCVLTTLLTLLGIDFVTAFSGALTALTNVGPGLGSIIGPAGNFAPLSDSAKWLLAVGMYLGRLEMLTVLVLFSTAFWRNVR